MNLLYFKFPDEPLTWEYSYTYSDDARWSKVPGDTFCSYEMPKATSFKGAAVGFFSELTVTVCRV